MHNGDRASKRPTRVLRLAAMVAAAAALTLPGCAGPKRQTPAVVTKPDPMTRTQPDTDVRSRVAQLKASDVDHIEFYGPNILDRMDVPKIIRGERQIEPFLSGLKSAVTRYVQNRVDIVAIHLKRGGEPLSFPFNAQSEIDCFSPEFYRAVQALPPRPPGSPVSRYTYAGPVPDQATRAVASRIRAADVDHLAFYGVHFGRFANDPLIIRDRRQIDRFLNGLRRAEGRTLGIANRVETMEVHLRAKKQKPAVFTFNALSEIDCYGPAFYKAVAALPKRK
jgi:hypothetical protein